MTVVNIEGAGWGAKSILLLISWYFWSACTLFLNKFVVFYMNGNSTFLACSQMWMTLSLGFLQMHYPLGLFKKIERKSRPKSFIKDMAIVGAFRFATVLLGILALNYIEVSFTETVKSSAPVVTVVVSRLLLGEVTDVWVNLSLIPVMAGLALCSANELSFNMMGFVCAMGTNVCECLQNVLCKMLVSADESNKYNPAEIQYYTSIFSLLIQLPALAFLLDPSEFQESFSHLYFVACIFNGIFYHFQTISAFTLMDYISPVTHSVANTVKRALLIWSSVIIFGNKVTPLSWLGTITVILGVFMYNKARDIDTKRRRLIPGISLNLKEARTS